MSLQASHEDLDATRRMGEKRERENTKLKSIISTQDERVGFTQTHTHTPLSVTHFKYVAQVKQFRSFGDVYFCPY